MTIPRERYRALRWAREWLHAVVLDPLVPPQARTEAEFLLNAYPSDQLLRTTIDRNAGLSNEIAEALSAASQWMFAFRHPTSDDEGLRWALRHMPRPGEIAMQKCVRDRGGVLANGHLCVTDWLEPDEDYVRAFIAGWVEDCAIAVGVEWLDALDSEIENAVPWYLISSWTSGVDFKSLKPRQLVLCTVPRSWDAAAREWMYVQSCDACQDAARVDAASDPEFGPCA